MSRKNNKRTVLVVTIIALVALLAIGATLALLTDSGTLTNILGIGRGKDGSKVVQIILDEPKYGAYIEALNDVTKGEVVRKDASDPTSPVTKASLYKIMPGDELDKDPTITLDNEVPIYLRMKVQLKNPTTSAMENAYKNLLLTTGDSGAAAGSPDRDGMGLSLPNASKWFEHGGWYYYDATAASQTAIPGNPTPDKLELFDNKGGSFTLKIPTSWSYDQIDKIASTTAGLELVVTVQVTQADNFTPDMTQADAWKIAGQAEPFIVEHVQG